MKVNELINELMKITNQGKEVKALVNNRLYDIDDIWNESALIVIETE